MISKTFKNLTAFIFIFLLAGCEFLPLAVPIMVSGAGGGVAYTVTNVAYKTFSYPMKKVEGATHTALKKMAINEVKREANDDDTVRIIASTKKLNIYIDLEQITPATTKISVNAKRNTLLKDKATATEIIEQTERALDRNSNGGKK